MNSVAVIPARLGSTRLLRKVLADVGGHPLLWHVWHRVQRARRLGMIYIATDAPEIAQTAQEWGAQVLMTSPDCRSGTERIASALHSIDGDLIINVQGDEPLVDPSMIDDLIVAWEAAPCDLVTPVFRIERLEELNNPNIVKVARTSQGQALYFSRSPIPFVRDLQLDQWLEHSFWGHIGVYGYRREILADYSSLPLSGLEAAEQLEQLRFLEAGYRFQTFETDYRSIAVDTAADLERVRQLMAKGDQ